MWGLVAWTMFDYLSWYEAEFWETRPWFLWDQSKNNPMQYAGLCQWTCCCWSSLHNNSDKLHPEEPANSQEEWRVKCEFHTTIIHSTVTIESQNTTDATEQQLTFHHLPLTVLPSVERLWRSIKDERGGTWTEKWAGQVPTWRAFATGRRKGNQTPPTLKHYAPPHAWLHFSPLHNWHGEAM